MSLHCFAHSARAAGLFDGWRAGLGPGVRPVAAPVPAPGALSRDTLLARAMEPFTVPGPGPYVLYGHGLGALIAYTVVRALHEAGLPGPALLAVGACPPPTDPARLPRAGQPPRPHDDRPAVPPGSDEGVLLRAALPVLRAEHELARALHEAARRPARAPLPATPLLLIAPRAADTDGWRRWTTGPVHTRTLPADEFVRRGAAALPRLLGRACRVAGRLDPQPAPVG
ncbi:thioesterase domain-containing protein [Streptomyces sp. NPDC006610]|uniref:thioesterase II family protein n=1 Tax=Streptomyces sp. NPDC006610 TaxID=3154584 RepID=UPI0033A0BEC5